MPALPDDEAEKLAADTSEEINRLAQTQFERLFQMIAEGTEARTAIDLVQQSFAGQFAERLAEAFTGLLQRAVGVGEVRALPVSGGPLSSRLYAHSIQTAAEVLAIVRQHAQGIHDARALALRLYDGYDPPGAEDRPLEGRARADLPAALRALTQDAETRKSLQALIERGRAQAKRMRSAALRAAYTEAFDAWAAGKGDEVLKRKVEVAMKEKNRYFANRIARTELARAHQAQVGADLMADDGVEVVQVVMNPMHPLVDVCDLHAKANLYGLGPGCYPKALAPQPPYHPHCWCKTRARRSLSGLVAREVDGGPAAWLRAMPTEDAARVVGSRERLQRVLDGEPVAAVIDDGKDRAYHLRRLGDGAGHPLIKGAK